MRLLGAIHAGRELLIERHYPDYHDKRVLHDAITDREALVELFSRRPDRIGPVLDILLRLSGH